MQNTVQRGERVSITESLLVHPTYSDGLVRSGDPVVVGRLVGVASTGAAPAGMTQLATTDKVAIELTGVFNLAVKSIHNGVQFGETVYIDPTTAALSDDLTGVPFGISVDETTIASGPTGGSIDVRLFGATPGATGAGS